MKYKQSNSRAHAPIHSIYWVSKMADILERKRERRQKEKKKDRKGKKEGKKEGTKGRPSPKALKGGLLVFSSSGTPLTLCMCSHCLFARVLGSLSGEPSG